MRPSDATPHPLDALFRPRSVAVIGASNDSNKVGGRPIAFLRRARWQGRIVPINGKGGEVQGLRAWPSLAAAHAELGEPIEQAIVAVPAPAVLAAADEALRCGAKALQVFSAGLGETDDRSLEGTLVARARASGARVLGPNSLGLFNAVDCFFGTFATALDGAWPRRGAMGVATQSGAFGSYFFGLAEQRGLRFSHFVATGNESDVDVADCLDFLVDDAATRIIVVAMEGCRDGRKLVRAIAKARSAGKPVFAMKVGASQAGAKAAATHTGSLAGADRVFDAALRGAGAVRLPTLEALVDAAYAASTTAAPRGRDLLVVTTSGGIGVLAADAAEAAGLALPEISSAAQQAIRAIAPLAGGANPVDTSAGILSDLSAYARIADAALAGSRFDAVLCYLAHIGRNPAHWAQLHEPLRQLRQRHPQMAFVAVLMAPDAVREALEANGFAVFADPSSAIAALAAGAGSASRRGGGVDAGTGSGHDGLAAPSHRALGAGAQPREPMAPRLESPLATEAAAKRALSACGISFPAERVVVDADAAVRAAREIGYPVVLKVISPDIAHKTEVGGVALGLGDDAAVHGEVGAMRERVAMRAPGARIEGFLVARQLAGGVELIVGTHVDASFGPIVSVGAGGVLAELLDDVAIRLAPIGHGAALAMLSDTRVGALLDGWRGAPAADRDALAAQVARLSQVAAGNADRVASIDLNPVLARADGAFALDALVVEHAKEPP